MISLGRCVVLLFVLLGACGCQPEEQVATYSLPRSAPPRPPLDAEAVLQRMDHILVGIAAQKDQAWFFKLVGKAPAIKRQRQAFDKFLETVELAQQSTDTPTWKLPGGWREKEKAGAMRAATLLVPDAEGELELAVSSLPLKGNWEEFLVPNVNRWLRQLQRRAVPLETVLGLSRQVPLQNGEATVWELSGIMTQQSMEGGRALAGAERAASKPPEAGGKELTYETPAGWLPGKMSSFRKVALLLPGGGATDGMTVTRFPAGPGSPMGDVTANVERWAGQVSMQPPTGDALEKLTEAIEVAGLEGTYVELLSPPEVEPIWKKHEI